MKRNRVVRLGPYMEAVMEPESLVLEDGALIVRGSGMDLVLPEEMEEKLRPLIGLRIAVLRTDISRRLYLVRVIEPKLDGMSGVDTAKGIA